MKASKVAWSIKNWKWQQQFNTFQGSKHHLLGTVVNGETRFSKLVFCIIITTSDPHFIQMVEKEFIFVKSKIMCWRAIDSCMTDKSSIIRADVYTVGTKNELQ